jgi:hypothetical protein
LKIGGDIGLAKMYLHFRNVAIWAFSNVFKLPQTVDARDMIVNCGWVKFNSNRSDQLAVQKQLENCCVPARGIFVVQKPWFDMLVSGVKTADVRSSGDEGLEPGDILLLKESKKTSHTMNIQYAVVLEKIFRVSRLSPHLKVSIFYHEVF